MNRNYFISRYVILQLATYVNKQISYDYLALRKNKPKEPLDPIVESIINNMKKESPQQRKELVRRLHAKRRNRDTLSLAERIAQQRNELRNVRILLLFI